ncbi:MAG TPA: M48 family metallopeptidase [bacterium]|jgi:predicted Zn-dependent protease|nr:M48 family metallopeptidase [bacterium]
MKRLLIATFLVLLVAGPAAPVHAQQQNSTAEEIRIGQEAARQLEAQFKVLTDEATVTRLSRVGRAVAAAADRDLPYTFKAVEIKEPNAVSLPGGFVYVTKGMLSFVRSDHELAAVLAHEVAHAAHGHQIEMMRRATRINLWTFILILLTRDPNIAVGAQAIGEGVLSGYTRDLERDADLTSIEYLVKTTYTPVATLTLMERLLWEERLRPEVDLGAFRDHPKTRERVEYITADLRRRGIPLIRRPAANYLRIALRTATENNKPIGELLVNETVVLRLPDIDRLSTIASRMDKFFNTDPLAFDVAVAQAEGGWGVFGRAQLLVAFAPAEQSAAIDLAARLRWLIDQDIRSRKFTG